MYSNSTIALALLLTPGIGSTTARRVVLAARALATPLGALVALPPRRLMEQMPPGTAEVTRALAECDRACVEHAALLMKRLQRVGAHALCCTDPDYPRAVIDSLGDHAPPLLFVLGDLDLLHTRMAAIVGARMVTHHGAQLAALCARVFCEKGVPVVSGGAPGVDQTAHGTCLDHDGRTVVILPQGLLTYHADGQLLDAVESGRAAIVSEFPPDASWLTHAAVTRNATISALADLVCVIEPRKAGGSIRTARCALEQGKSVLVHAADGPESPTTALRQAGAAQLLDGHGRFSAQRILSAWAHGGKPRAPQPELF